MPEATATALTAAPSPPPLAIAPYDFQPTTLEQAMKLAEMLAGSTLVPKDYINKPGNVLVAMQMGFELGLKTMQALSNIAVINGRAAVWGDAMLALVLASPVCEYVREPQPTAEEASCHAKRRGQPEVVRTFTKADANRAGLLVKDGPWKQYTPRMLQMRARAFALRDVFPDVLRGMPIAEELRDIEVDVTAQGTHTLEPAAAPAEVKTTKSSALAERLKAAKPPKIDDVVKAFADSTNGDDLVVAMDMAKKLTSDKDKEIANGAYHAARKRLQNGARENGTATATAPDIAEVRALLAKATTRDEADAAGSMIDQVQTTDDLREALRADYKAVREKFEAK